MNMPQLNELARKFNESFARGDKEFILASVTEDVTWWMVGDQTIHGKEGVSNVLDMFENEGKPELTIGKIITHGRTAAVEGTMKAADKSGVMKTYAFCDTYVLNKFKNGKIKEINSFVIEVQEQ